MRFVEPLLRGQPSSGAPLTVSVGFRLNWADYDQKSEERGPSLALGGDVRYRLPDLEEVSLGGSFYYAPSALALIDSEGYSDLHLFVGYEVIPNGEVYLGWRRLKNEFEDDGWVAMDDGVHVGIRLQY